MQMKGGRIWRLFLKNNCFYWDSKKQSHVALNHVNCFFFYQPQCSDYIGVCIHKYVYVCECIQTQTPDTCKFMFSSMYVVVLHFACCTHTNKYYDVIWICSGLCILITFIDFLHLEYQLILILLNTGAFQNETKSLCRWVYLLVACVRHLHIVCSQKQ